MEEDELKLEYTLESNGDSTDIRIYVREIGRRIWSQDQRFAFQTYEDAEAYAEKMGYVPYVDPDQGETDPDVCPHCGSRNTLDHDPPDGHECHDCGKEYK